MPVKSIPIDRVLLGNEHWLSYSAENEIEVYCDLLDYLQNKTDTLEARGKDEEVALANAQAVISSYAFEIAMKSLWALDNTPESVPKTHDLLELFEGLKAETIEALGRLKLSRAMLKEWPTPFLTNRYSMESISGEFTVYHTEFLRSLTHLLRDKLEQTRKDLLGPPGSAPF